MSFDEQPGFRGAGGPVAPIAPSVPSPIASPATLVPDLSFAGSVGTAVGHRSRDHYTPVYSHNAVSPLPYLAVVLMLVVAAAFYIAGANGGETVTNRISDPVFIAHAVVMPTFDGADTWTGIHISIALAVATLVAGAALISRLGRNLRVAGSRFGALFVLAALPAWWAVPWALGLEAPVGYGEILFRNSMVLLFILVQYGLLQAPLFGRLWDAGQLPNRWLSALLWSPPVFFLSMFWGAMLFTFVSVGEDGRGDSSWEPTDRMVDLVNWSWQGTAAGLLLLLMVVSVVQHRQIRVDRAEILAERKGRVDA